MQIERIVNIKEAVASGPSLAIDVGIKRLKQVRPCYSGYIEEVIRSGNLEKQLFSATEETKKRERTRENSEVGAYFNNEEITGGSRVSDVLNYTDKRNDWMKGKLKLGPGISLIEPPKLYQTLLKMGEQKANLLINYDAPFGTQLTRQGIKRMMDCKIDPDGDFFNESGVYLTQGATEGIDLFMQMLAGKYQGAKVGFLGISYYTGPYSAAQKGLTTERFVASNSDIVNKGQFFPSAEDVLKRLSADVKALVLTMPNNPNGEAYSGSEIKKILQVVKDRNLLLLFDCIFEDMYFDNSRNYKSEVLRAAKEIEALDNVVVVDSLSKRQNIPGSRIGFLATTNDKIAESLEDIVIARRCNPPLVVEPLVQFEALAREVKILQMQNPAWPADALINKIMGQNQYSFDTNLALKMYNEWNEWGDLVRKYYRDNLQIVNTILEKTVATGSPNEAAFNTFVKLSNIPEGTNSNDFLAKLMFTLATYTQSGACFGMSQESWDRYYGLWVRISYATNRSELIEGLLRLIVFTEQYVEKDLGNGGKYPVLPIRYDAQK
jgi:aspartate/methionine/tyrosine aminotransferase